MTRITLVGGLGRMGLSILSCLDDSFELIEVVGRPGSSAIGQSFSQQGFESAQNQIIVDQPSLDCDVVIDFASGSGFSDLALLCAKKQWALVSGRTGLDSQDQETLNQAAQKIAVLQAGNMSLGANLLNVLVSQVAQALPKADIEIIETHHIHKKDAPSGTAMALVQAIKQARSLSEADFVYGREGQTGVKPSRQVGVHAIRSGETVGEHTVMYGLSGEKIELSHKAFDRRIFAQGALAAASWIADQPPGRWTMKDVLGF